MAGRHRAQRRGGGAGSGAVKVPTVGPYFWAVKLLTTAMGEAVSDFLVRQINPYLAVVVTFGVFAAAMAWQLRVPEYRTWPYWTAVAMVAVFGTMMADSLHVAAGVPYRASALLFAVCLTVALIAWYRVEGTLSIHSIATPRRELFYWATVCATFALGTAAGDMSATTLHLGYLASGLAFTAAICVPLVAWRLGANAVLTFWTAYILTRPIGASFADFFGMPRDAGAMGYGHGAVSAVTLVLVAVSLAYLSRSGIDLPEAEPGSPGAPARAASAPERPAVRAR